MYRTNEKLKQCISMPIQPGGRRQGPSFKHYPNGEMEELTESPLYLMIITVDDNTHSGGGGGNPDSGPSLGRTKT